MKRLSISSILGSSRGSNNKIVEVAPLKFVAHRSGTSRLFKVDDKNYKAIRKFLERKEIRQFLKTEGNSEVKNNYEFILDTAKVGGAYEEEALEEPLLEEIEFQIKYADGTYSFLLIAVVGNVSKIYLTIRAGVPEGMRKLSKEYSNDKKLLEDLISAEIVEVNREYLSTSSLSGTIKTEYFLEEVIKKGIEYSSYESDLYIPKTKETTELIRKYEYPNQVTTFRSEKPWETTDTKDSYEIPFAYNSKLAKQLLKKYKKDKAKASADLSPKQEEYQEFFKNKLEEHEVKSPAELDEEGKKKFFSEIEKEWTKDEGKSTSEHFFNLEGAGFTVEIEDNSLFVLPAKRDPLTNEKQLELDGIVKEWKQSQNEYEIKIGDKKELKKVLELLDMGDKFKKVKSMFSSMSNNSSDLLGLVNATHSSKVKVLEISEYDDLLNDLIIEANLYIPAKESKGKKILQWKSGSGFEILISEVIDYKRETVTIENVEIINTSDNDKPSIKSLRVLSRYGIKDIVSETALNSKHSIVSSKHYEVEEVIINQEEYKNLEEDLKKYAKMLKVIDSSDLEGRDVTTYRLVEGEEGIMELDIVFVEKSDGVYIQVIKLEKTVKAIKPLIKTMETLTKYGLRDSVVSWEGDKV
jgi:hypothetical protein